MSDLELLKRYASDRDQQAFAELVRRHSDWIYSAALRQVRDRQLAEDVTQAVFLALSQRSASLVQGKTTPGKPAQASVLAAWLFEVTRCASASTVRSEMRRKKHEKQAAMELKSESDMTSEQWDQIAPLLDELVAKLGRTDRTAVLSRFYQKETWQEVGEALGVSAEVARKRMDRILPKLRKMLARKELTMPASVLAVGLLARTTQAAPANLANSVATLVASGERVVRASAIAQEALRMMAWAKAKTVALAFGVLAFVATAATAMLSRAPTVVFVPPSGPVVSPVAVAAALPIAQRMADASQIVPGLASLMVQIAQGARAQTIQPVSTRCSGIPSTEPLAYVLAGTLHDPADPRGNTARLYFIPEERWPGPPVAWGRVCTNQQFQVGDLAPGSYYVLAVKGGSYFLGGDPFVFDAIGLPEIWPKPVKITTSATPATGLDIQVSAPLAQQVRSRLESMSRQTLPTLDANSAQRQALRLSGRVIDEAGQPIPFALVEASEVVSGAAADGGVRPTATSNMDGYYGFVTVPGAYELAAYIWQPLKDQLGFRLQYLCLNEVLRRQQQVDMVIPTWPTQTGRIVGEVSDRQGRPLEAFSISVLSPPSWPNRGAARADGGGEKSKWIDVNEMRANFFDGQFGLDAVPAGDCRVQVLGADGSRVAEQVVTVAPGGTVKLTLRAP